MVEVFAAVASGAGLLPLAIQLLESSQKLKGLYNASKNAPNTISDLCFELETLSLQLRQLERHRQLDRLDTQVLDHCIAVCERRVVRVRDVVDAMARYMRRGIAFGSIYTAFKEPEMRKLLEDLEQAKSSLSLAYITYCQYVAAGHYSLISLRTMSRSWNMRNSANQALALQRQSEVLALQQLQLEGIQQNLSRRNALLAAHATIIPTNGVNTRIVKNQTQRCSLQRKKDSICLRLPLSQWLTSRTWMFSARQSQGSWTLNIRPVYLRACRRIAAYD
jgi:hypothetical protein